jgi:hypothetical protein
MGHCGKKTQERIVVSVNMSRSYLHAYREISATKYLLAINGPATRWVDLIVPTGAKRRRRECRGWQ